MDIIIPTLGRAGRQTTYDNMPDFIKTMVTHVVQAEDYKNNKNLYSRLNRVVVLPAHIKDIATTREYIMGMEEFSNEIVMMDDDLVFSARRIDDPTKFRNMNDDDWKVMIYDLGQVLSRNAHAGISHREGANRNTDQYAMATRQMRVLGYNRPMLEAAGVEFGRIPLMEDFDVTLQLLEKGRTNIILNDYVHNQGGSNTSGGCSSFRTLELQAECAERLAELHPQFVTVVEKTTKAAWGGATRKDVRVQWKKALEWGNSHGQ